MSITRALQAAADDLGVVETALIALYSSIRRDIPQAMECRVKPVFSPKPAPIQKPDLPRCCAVRPNGGGQCKQPATAPHGLCIQHFLGRYGHTYGGAYTFTKNYGEYHCKNCTKSWRYPRGDTPEPLRRELEEEQRQAIRTECPAKVSA